MMNDIGTWQGRLQMLIKHYKLDTEAMANAVGRSQRDLFGPMRMGEKMAPDMFKLMMNEVFSERNRSHLGEDFCAERKKIETLFEGGAAAARMRAELAEKPVVRHIKEAPTFITVPAALSSSLGWADNIVQKANHAEIVKASHQEACKTLYALFLDPKDAAQLLEEFQFKNGKLEPDSKYTDMSARIKYVKEYKDKLKPGVGEIALEKAIDEVIYTAELSWNFSQTFQFAIARAR